MRFNPEFELNAGRRFQGSKERDQDGYSLPPTRKPGRVDRAFGLNAPYDVHKEQPNHLISLFTKELVERGDDAAVAELARRGRNPDGSFIEKNSLRARLSRYGGYKDKSSEGKMTRATEYRESVPVGRPSVVQPRRPARANPSPDAQAARKYLEDKFLFFPADTPDDVLVSVATNYSRINQVSNGGIQAFSPSRRNPEFEPNAGRRLQWDPVAKKSVPRKSRSGKDRPAPYERFVPETAYPLQYSSKDLVDLARGSDEDMKRMAMAELERRGRLSGETTKKGYGKKKVWNY